MNDREKYQRMMDAYENEVNRSVLEDFDRKVHEAASYINYHITHEGDPLGVLALAIDILDHQIGVPCPVCAVVKRA